MKKLKFFLILFYTRLHNPFGEKRNMLKIFHFQQLFVFNSNSFWLIFSIFFRIQESKGVRSRYWSLTPAILLPILLFMIGYIMYTYCIVYRVSLKKLCLSLSPLKTLFYCTKVRLVCTLYNEHKWGQGGCRCNILI